MPHSSVPQHCPTHRELDDLELLVSGAFAPLTAFNEPGSPVTLSLPPEIADAGTVELVDPEGLPLARVTSAPASEPPVYEVEPLTHAQYGPFRRLYLTPEQTRERYAGRTFVPVADPLTREDLDRIREAGPVVLLALVGAGTPSLSPVALLRATLAAAAGLDAAVVAVPLATHGDPDTDHALGVRVVDNYAGSDPVLALSGERSSVETYHSDVQAIIDEDRPPVDEQGLVLFFTGLSGSGKSTLARALMDRILEQGERTVTSLDGDVVRRNLSAGLTFSKEDRETNIRRIGWVAAEISRHGGIAVCSPIAPFDETRQQVRAMVEDAGGAFFLVHVATPLEECERRDRKGLYARARRGEIPEFTGISSPYEEPDDAAVRVDTTGRSIEEALRDVTQALANAGYVDLGSDLPPVEEASAAPLAPSHDPRPLEVLFVCTANICRSPFMEHVARQLAGEDPDIVFSSAGTHGFVERPVDEEIAATLKLRELDTSEFRSRPLTPELLEESDLVLTAEAAHRNFILADHPEYFRKVFTLGQFVEALEKVDGADLSREELLERLGESRGAADSGLGVADPYRRGPEAAAAAASHIEELLRVVVPALTRSRKITP